MAFCMNCGQQLMDGARFCPGCGTPMGGAPMGGAPMGGAPMGGAPMGGMPMAAPAMPAGMRTPEEVSQFYLNTLQMKENYVKKYYAGIQKLVGSIAPNEAIQFASHCVLGGIKGGSQCEFACTNQRIIFVETPSGIVATNRALKGKGAGAATLSLRYNMIAGVQMKKGMLAGNIYIDTVSGDTYLITVDKPWTEIIYKGINDAVYSN